MKSTRSVVILVSLVAVMIVVYARAFGMRPRPAVQRDAAAAPTAASAAATSASEPAPPLIDRAALRERAREISWGRDPFGRGDSAGASGLTLSGILWDATSPVAIINGSMVHAGQELDGYRVAEIAQDHVVLTDGSQTITLHTAP